MNVLIVEDEEINVKLLEIMFKKIEDIKNITVASNGKEAVDLCKLHSFNIILMDIRMPIMDGFEATKEIKKFKKDIPIVALTTFTFDYIDEGFKEAGFDYYMQKPVSINALRKYIERVKN